MSKLFLIPTPIGNLEDITLRALRVLNEVDVVLAEDTRKTGLLLKHFEIKNKLIPYHQHNEHKITHRIVQQIQNGETMALVTNAGTPAISDPGYLLVRECISNNIEVECLPGPTAFVLALVNSGLPTDHFVFEGFLPVKKGRKAKLNSLINQTYTMVFYESPHRLIKTLEQFREIFGHERKACICRELTKVYEEKIRGSLSELIQHFSEKSIKGEFVIVVEGKK